MKRTRSKLLLVIAVMLLVLGGIYLAVDRVIVTDAEQQAIYEKAKARCTSEMWPVYEDIGPVMMPEPLRPPYPESYKDAVHGIPHGYGCTKQEAQTIR